MLYDNNMKLYYNFLRYASVLRLFSNGSVIIIGEVNLFTMDADGNSMIQQHSELMYLQKTASFAI